MFMKHYAPNRCLYIKVAKIRTGVGSAEMSHHQNIQRALQVFYKKNKIIIIKNKYIINLLIILYQLTEFEDTSCNTFRGIMITNFQSPNLQREIIRKNKITFFLFSSSNLLIILYQLTKIESPICYSFPHIMITNFQSPNLQREINRKK